jgi:hypothetical protein
MRWLISVILTSLLRIFGGNLIVLSDSRNVQATSSPRCGIWPHGLVPENLGFDFYLGQSRPFQNPVIPEMDTA